MATVEELQQELARMKAANRAARTAHTAAELRSANQDFQQALVAMNEDLDGLLQVVRTTPFVGRVLRRAEQIRKGA